VKASIPQYKTPGIVVLKQSTQDELQKAVKTSRANSTVKVIHTKDRCTISRWYCTTEIKRRRAANSIQYCSGSISTASKRQQTHVVYKEGASLGKSRAAAQWA